MRSKYINNFYVMVVRRRNKTRLQMDATLPFGNGDRASQGRIHTDDKHGVDRNCSCWLLLLAGVGRSA